MGGKQAHPGKGEPLRSFGRRRTKRLQGVRRERLEKGLPGVEIAPGEGVLDPATLFPFAPRAVWLEIGFGGGEHLAGVASQNLDVGFLGCEPFMDGVSKLLAAMEENNLSNIRVWPEDSRQLLARLPGQSLEKVFILFPDPWPKQRHHKRRLVNTALLDELARVMKPGGLLTLATDHADYAEWMLLHLLADARFRWTANVPEDFRDPPPGWVETRYQQKAAAEGRAPTFLLFEKNA